MRHAKALQSKSRQHHITRLSDSHYHLVSGTSGAHYAVNPVELTCSCPYGQHRPRYDKRSGCSHILAVLSYIKQMEEERVLSVWATEESALASHHSLSGGLDGLILTSRKV